MFFHSVHSIWPCQLQFPVLWFLKTQGWLKISPHLWISTARCGSPLVRSLQKVSATTTPPTFPSPMFLNTLLGFMYHRLLPHLFITPYFHFCRWLNITPLTSPHRTPSILITLLKNRVCLTKTTNKLTPKPHPTHSTTPISFMSLATSSMYFTSSSLIRIASHPSYSQAHSFKCRRCLPMNLHQHFRYNTKLRPQRRLIRHERISVHYLL